MRFAVLGSGSGGNSTVVECDGRYLLVDAGLSAKQLILRLECLGLSPKNLAGILLTHEHGDHIRGLDVFLRNFRVPLVASIMTGRVVQESLRELAQWVAFESGQQFHWEGFDLTTFAISHDAVEPVGYVIGRGDCRVGVATDLGYADAKVIQALQGVEGLVLEANYDWQMLEADLKRPFSTKQRISSRHGHLSNEQAAELVAELVPAGLKRVVLGHLSSDCNCPLKAVEVVRERTGRGNLEICAASQNEVTEWQSIVPELPLLSASCVPPASAFPDCSAKIKQHQAAPVPSVIEERADCRNPAVIGPLPYESGIRPRVDLVRGVEAHLFSGIIVGHDLNVELPGELKIHLKWINPGTFLMGSPEGELGRFDDEDQGEVRMTQGYWLGIYPVTQGQWQAVMGDNPSHFKKSGLNAPVECVSWEDAMAFCRKLTETEREAGRLPEGYEYALPTEAQWEYACRAGSQTALHNGKELTSETGTCYHLNEVGWYDENSGSQTHPVGEKQGNAWGIYDLHGNVLEWCQDPYYNGISKGTTDRYWNRSGQVLRGGSWRSLAGSCRSAYRRRGDECYRLKDRGFRLSLQVQNG